jgi:predicted ATP-grasp superfamily ATP-dependent carboligase
MAWDAETIRNKNIQRLSEIAEETHEECDYQNAIKAIDVLNKTANVYIDKKEINIDGNEISFTFGTGEAK